MLDHSELNTHQYVPVTQQQQQQQQQQILLKMGK